MNRMQPRKERSERGKERRERRGKKEEKERRERGGKERKAVSPIIATVLLVSFVVVVAGIVWVFFGQFIKEAITKEQKTVEALCADSVKVKANAVLTEKQVLLENNGDIPLAGFFLKLSRKGEAQQIYFACTVERGKSTTCPLPDDQFSGFKTLVTTCEKAEIIPVLLGVGSKGKYKLAECKEQAIVQRCR